METVNARTESEIIDDKQLDSQFYTYLVREDGGRVLYTKDAEALAKRVDKDPNILNRIELINGKNPMDENKYAKEVVFVSLEDSLSDILVNIAKGNEDISEQYSKFENIINKYAEKNPKAFALLYNSELDPTTVNHSLNVMALTVGTFLEGKSPSIFKNEDIVKAVTTIATGALLHDIGKSSPEVKKLIELPRKLTDEEMNIVREHPRIGYELLKEKGIENDLVLSFAYNHHQRGDNTGYPGMSEEVEMSRIVWIFTLIDSYEAMTSPKREYNTRRSPQEAISMLKEDCVNGKYGDKGTDNIHFLEKTLKSLGQI